MARRLSTRSLVTPLLKCVCLRSSGPFLPLFHPFVVGLAYSNCPHVTHICQSGLLRCYVVPRGCAYDVKFSCIPSVLSYAPVSCMAQGDGFITYWSEVARPHRPVRWRFYDGAQFEVRAPVCACPHACPHKGPLQSHIAPGRTMPACTASAYALRTP